MKLYEKKLRGYTILEMLIATAIFAVVMVLATSIVAQSVAYQSKIKAMRATSNEARKTADYINNSIRQANIEGTVTPDSSTPTAVYKSGIALFDCQYLSPTRSCQPEHLGTNVDKESIYNGDGYNGSDSVLEYRANTLVVFWKVDDVDHYRVIFSYPAKSQILVIDGLGSSVTTTDSTNLIAVIGEKIVAAQDGYTADHTNVKWDEITLSGRYPIAADDNAQVIQTDSVVAFGGLTPTNSNPTDKAYVLYDVFVNTRNTGAVRPADRASLHIRSAVTSRDF